jgi:hypothetical protein
MGNNLFISYDLMSPGQNYEAVIARIKQLGTVIAVHKSLWYVNSVHSATKARDHVAQAADTNDKILVIDTSNNAASWSNLPQEIGQFISDQWNK